MALRILSSRRAWLLVASLALAALACEQGRRYEGTGRVVEVIADEGQIVLDHDEIPGLMDAMTMSFDADASLLESVEVGQRVEFTLLVSQSGFRMIEVRALAAAGDGAGAPADGRRFAAALARGERAPGFSLIDQDGEPISLADLAGRTLLIDFVFTQCQGPCPILTARQVAVQRALAPEVAAQSWFVSISLDPANDTPAELTRYATARGADLSRWSFLTGEPERVTEVVANYGVGTTRDAQGTLEHVVAAFLVDRQGRIARRYLGLDHGSAELASDLRDLASLAP